MEIKEGKIFYAILKRQFKLHFADAAAILNAIFFFVIALTFFKIASGYHKLPGNIALSYIFCSIIFTMLLSIQSVLEDDYRNGFLEQFILTGGMPELWLIAKYTASFIIFCINNVVMLAISILLLNINNDLLILFIATTLLTMIILLLLMLASALTLGSNSSLTNAIIIIPLFIPNIIFTMLAFDNSSYLLIMLAIFMFFFPIIIIAIKYAIIFALRYS